MRYGHTTKATTAHSLKDTTAIITHRVRVEHSDVEVDSFLFSSMLYESPKILLNVGMGDYGRVRQAECDCQFGQLGSTPT